MPFPKSRRPYNYKEGWPSDGKDERSGASYAQSNRNSYSDPRATSSRNDYGASRCERFAKIAHFGRTEANNSATTDKALFSSESKEAIPSVVSSNDNITSSTEERSNTGYTKSSSYDNMSRPPLRRRPLSRERYSNRYNNDGDNSYNSSSYNDSNSNFSNRNDLNSQEDDSSFNNVNSSSFNRNDSNYERDNSSYERDNSNYERDNSGYERDSSNYERDNSNYERDNSNYERDNSNYARDNSNYDRDNSGYDRDGSNYDNDGSSYRRSNSSYSRGDYSRERGYRSYPRRGERFSSSPREHERYPRRSSRDGGPIYGPVSSRNSRFSRSPFPRRGEGRIPSRHSRYSERDNSMGNSEIMGIKSSKGGPSRAMQAKTSAMIAGIHGNDTLTSHALSHMNGGLGYNSYDRSYKDRDDSSRRRSSRYSSRHIETSSSTIEEDAAILRRFKALMNPGSIPEDEIPPLPQKRNIVDEDDNLGNESEPNKFNVSPSKSFLATNGKPYINSYIPNEEEQVSETEINHVPLTTSSDGNTQSEIRVVRRRRGVEVEKSQDSLNSNINANSTNTSAYDNLSDDDDDDSLGNRISEERKPNVYTSSLDEESDHSLANSQYDDEDEDDDRFNRADDYDNYQNSNRSYASSEDDEDDDLGNRIDSQDKASSLYNNDDNLSAHSASRNKDDDDDEYDDDKFNRMNVDPYAHYANNAYDLSTSYPSQNNNYQEDMYQKPHYDDADEDDFDDDYDDEDERHKSYSSQYQYDDEEDEDYDIDEEQDELTDDELLELNIDKLMKFVKLTPELDYLINQSKEAENTVNKTYESSGIDFTKPRRGRPPKAIVEAKNAKLAAIIALVEALQEQGYDIDEILQEGKM